MADKVQSKSASLGPIFKLDMFSSMSLVESMILNTIDKPIILIGHSFGASDVIELAQRLPRVDLLVTIGYPDPARLYDTQICIGFNGKTIAEWVINQRKVGSALRQINFYTDHWASDWLINETPIPGVENYLISPSSYQVEHSEADDEFLYNGLPNPAWEIILSAIDDIIDRYRNK